MLLKSEWLWNQYEDKGNDQQTPEEATYLSLIHISNTKEVISNANDSIIEDWMKRLIYKY